MLAKKYRILKDQEYQRVLKKGQTFFGPFFNIKILANNLSNSRFGFIISTKISRSAVIRNTLRRRLNECISKIVTNISPNFDIIFLTKAPSTTIKSSQLLLSLESLLISARLLKK